MPEAAGTHTGEITAQAIVEPPKPLAPIWHSMLLLALIFVPLTVIPGMQSFLRGMPRWALLPMDLSFTWGLVLFLHWGMTLKGQRLGDLLKGRWQEENQLRDEVVLGLQMGFFILVLSLVMRLVLGSFYTSRPGPPPLRTIFGLGSYLASGLTAGFGEELIFRGYLFRQMKFLTGNSAVALVGQAALFGLAHGYDQTLAGFMDKFISGLIFGSLAIRRKSLLSSMVAHASLDCTVALLIFAVSSVSP